MAFRFDLPEIDDPYLLADWVEIMMLLSQKRQISRTDIIEAFVEKLASTSQEMETPVIHLFNEISRRRRIANKGYPLEVDDEFIKLDSSANAEFYKFLLLISKDGPMRRKKKFKDIDEVFDKVVCAAIKQYLGNGSDGVRFGHPASDDRPKQFKKAVEWLSTKVGVPVGKFTPPRNSKDGGVDVVVWKPFADQRSAFAIILAQCTVQTKWLPKSKDIVESAWRSLLVTGTCTLTALAIPFVIPKNFDQWDSLRHTVGVVFDRLRLAQMLAEVDATPFTKMIKWSNKEISQYSLD